MKDVSVENEKGLIKGLTNRKLKGIEVYEWNNGGLL